MRKKDILGNGWLVNGFNFNSSMKKISGTNKGYSALIEFLPGTREIKDKVSGQAKNLSGNGYKWLIYHPLNECWVLTAIYDPMGNLLQWYFDLSRYNYIDENGIPCRDDIYLDLILLPNGHAITKDAGELQEALDKGVITSCDYNHAYKIRDHILSSKWMDIDMLTEFCNKLLVDYTNLD